MRIEGILWILRTVAPWRDLPAYFGNWKSVYDRFRAWTRSGLWTAILEMLRAASADHEYVMIASTSMRVHAHGANPAGGQIAQGMGRSKASLSTKIHMACDALGYPLSFILTGANVSDFDQAKPLIKRHLRPESYAIMDKGYDSDAIRECVNQQRGIAVIAIHPNRSPNQPLTNTYTANVTGLKISSPGSKIPPDRHSLRKTPPCFSAMLSIACILLWITA